jgi:hypothetical protein
VIVEVPEDEYIRPYMRLPEPSGRFNPPRRAIVRAFERAGNNLTIVRFDVREQEGAGRRRERTVKFYFLVDDQGFLPK